MKNRSKQVIQDMIPVILGIVIVLMLNNWKESRDTKKFVNNVLSSVQKEIIENKVELEEIIIEHKALLDTISQYMENDSILIGHLISKTNGVSLASIKNNAWK
ncbi:MAG: hypothetical protein ACI81Y_002270 [Glaciecola sp.]